MNATVKLQRVDYLRACWLFNAKLTDRGANNP